VVQPRNEGGEVGRKREEGVRYLALVLLCVHCKELVQMLFRSQDAELVWRSPPSRQLSREKRVEYESDVKERFYDDYLGKRTSAHALSTLSIHHSLYT